MDIFSKQSIEEQRIKLKKEDYSIGRVEIKGRRHYEVKDKNGTVIGAFPSVTTILGATQNTWALDRWRKNIGEVAAHKISTDATNRGTVMHRLNELYCNLPANLDNEIKLKQTLEAARNDTELLKFDNRAIIIGGHLFYNLYYAGFFDRIEYGIFQEKFLWNKLERDGQDLSYAGTGDNLSHMITGENKLIDFKTSKRPKDDKQIHTYKKQVAAYAYAIKERYDIMPDGAEIWVSNELERTPQQFILNSNDLEKYFEEFLVDRIAFNEIFEKLGNIEDVL